MALSQGGRDARDWERSLYHGGSVKDEQEALAARSSCYDAVISALKKTLFPERKGGMGRDVAAIHAAEGDIRSLNERGDAMLKYMVLQSADRMFHNQLYMFLKEADAERLVKIESRFVEDFLQETDQSLLYRYYVLKERYEDAMSLMEKLAGSDGLKLTQRVDYLRKATASARNCLERMLKGAHNRRRAGHADIESGRVQELESRREIAELQLETVEGLKAIHQRVQKHQDSAVQNLAATIQRLEESLLSVSELFNDAAFPYNLWEVCLRILHACNHEDIAKVQEFWRQIIYRLVPQDANDEQVRQWLQLRRKMLVVDNVMQTQGNFEDLEWPEQLALHVTELGRKLYGHGADFTFPVDLICRELLELGLRHAECRADSNPVIAATERVVAAMTEIPISYAVLADVFVDLLENDRQGGFLPATLALLEIWLAQASQADASFAAGSNKSVLQQLADVVRTRRFDDWLERASSRTVAVHTSTDAQAVRAKIDKIRTKARELTQRLRS